MDDAQAQRLLIATRRTNDLLRRCIAEQSKLESIMPEKIEVWSDYVRGVVECHVDTLTAKRRELTVRGDYGELSLDLWWQEIRYFLAKVCLIADHIVADILPALIMVVDEEVDKVDTEAQ